MPIYRLFKDYSFDPDDIGVLVAAFDDALRQLGLVDREDPATITVAKLILELAKSGERDPTRLCEGAVESLRS